MFAQHPGNQRGGRDEDGEKEGKKKRKRGGEEQEEITLQQSQPWSLFVLLSEASVSIMGVNNIRQKRMFQTTAGLNSQ